MRAMRGAWDGWRRACEHAAFLAGVALARFEAAAEHGARPAPAPTPAPPRVAPLGAYERGMHLRPGPRRKGVLRGAALSPPLLLPLPGALPYSRLHCTRA